MQSFSTITKVILIVLFVLFCAFNANAVRFVLVPGKFVYELPLFLPTLLGVVVGIGITSVIFFFKNLKLSNELKQTQASLNKLQKQVEEIKSAPLINSTD